ncbi:MAG: aldehyde ferredoxin oxidoreductase family protein [Candidatus Thorarchaeota archaeon]
MTLPFMKGYMGEFLFVDLTKGSVQRKPLNWDYARDFIGGAGYAARLLYERLAVETLDPFHPDNEVAIFTGPLTATGAPCTGRHAICTKSALTGIWGESTGGGYFGAELRYAGFDGILITGAASSPVYLYIQDNEAQLRPADYLWGKNTYETEEILRTDIREKKLRVLSIGPAGENKVRFAAIMNDLGRASARAGAGAIFGAKQLKAIAVRGSQKPQLADPKTLREHSKAVVQILENFIPILGANGTLFSADMLMNVFNDMPVRYFSKASKNIEKINAKALSEYRSGRFHCHICPIGCGPIISVKSDAFSLVNVAGPEYESVASLGTLCENDDLALICQANHLCDLYGLDTISCGNVIAFSFIAHEQGKIPRNLVGSLNLQFGDAITVIRLIELIAQREGLGAILAEGVKYAADKFGIPELAIHVKGLEVPMHDPRAFFGMALSYAVSPVGANHMQGEVVSVDMGVEIEEFGIEPFDRHRDEGRGLMVAKIRNWQTVLNSLIVCKLGIGQPSTVIPFIKAATGRDVTVEQLYEIGERTMTLKRAFNIRCGITAKDDTLPPALLQPHATGLNEGKIPNLNTQLNEFYDCSQWDSKTGKPTVPLLVRLGLDDVVKDLW